MVLVRKLPFFQLFFQAIQARKMSFMIFQNVKTPFYAIKTRTLKRPKIDILPNGLIHGFGPNMAIFPTLFFRQYWQENVFYDILKRKNAFLGYKKPDVEMSKNGQFSKGVNPCFWSKNGHFSNFLFLGNIKTRSLKGPKNGQFSKGINPCFWSKNCHFSNFLFLGNVKNKKFKKSKN